MSKIFLFLVITTALIAAVVIFLPQSKTQPENQAETQETKQGQEKNHTHDENTPEHGHEASEDSQQTQQKTIVYAQDGYSPDSLEINKGDTVYFKNGNSNRNMWTASVIHPTHTKYPNSSISKCGTAEEGTMFDMCEAMGEGGEWSFTFNETGTWGYHNHLSPNHTGEIIVK